MSFPDDIRVSTIAFAGTVSETPMQLQEELDRARESPPLPDRDDSPPPIHRPVGGANALNGDGVQWRDPTLNEVLDYLVSGNNVIRLNAAGYLQHLTFADSDTKRLVRELGGIPRLIDMLNSDIPEIQKNACGCLRNICYGRDNDENKRAIAACGGIVALVNLLRKTPDVQVKEEISGALWNMSSCDVSRSSPRHCVQDLKRLILELSAEPLVKQVIIPASGWTSASSSLPVHGPAKPYNSSVFKNATGVLRNVSAATDAARKLLRDTPGLVDALYAFVRSAVLDRHDYESRPVENCVCILRNVSYRNQEIDDANYDAHAALPHVSTTDVRGGQAAIGGKYGERSRSAPSNSPKLSQKHQSKLFKGGNKKGGASSPPSDSPYLQRPASGVNLLWSPELIQVYGTLLKNSSNGATLEAAAGAIQNLAACYWLPSQAVRTVVRQEKILPLFVELLRIPDDRVNCAVATAMRNLAIDAKNRDLIGQYAMGDLTAKLPPIGVATRSPTTSDMTLCGVLAVLYEILRANSQFVRKFVEEGGADKLMAMCQPPASHQVIELAQSNNSV